MTSGELSGCVIVSGMPGAGKSTVTALAARLLPRAAQVKGNDVNPMIRSGRVWFMGEPKEEALRQDELCNRNMCWLANNFVDFGFTVLMDTVVADRAELDFLFALMSPRPVRLVTLAPGVGVCEHRNATRDADERFEFDDYHRLEADMTRDLGDVGWWSTRPRSRLPKPLSSSSSKPPFAPLPCGAVRTRAWSTCMTQKCTRRSRSRLPTAYCALGSGGSP